MHDPSKMISRSKAISRRGFLAAAGAGLAAAGKVSAAAAAGAGADKALVAITLDLEMARNFPHWNDTEWDYIKGNLNQAAKDYVVGAAKRVKAQGGVVHCFVVGRVFEQANVDWLKKIVDEGHPVGNHTYDHVYVLAKKREEIQYRFRRAPWLIHGQAIDQVIRENIELANMALKNRIGIEPAGFRTPGGFSTGLDGRPDVQKMLLDLGFDWVSCKYPAHPYSKPHEAPTQEVLDGIVQAQAAAQPFVYPTGLVDVPMSPISDIGGFRTCRWKLEYFMKAVELAVAWTIEHRATFDFLAHPSCLGVVDPEYKTIDLICKMVREAGDRAALVDVGALASRARASSSS